MAENVSDFEVEESGASLESTGYTETTAKGLYSKMDDEEEEKFKSTDLIKLRDGMLYVPASTVELQGVDGDNKATDDEDQIASYVVTGVNESEVDVYVTNEAEDVEVWFADVESQEPNGDRAGVGANAEKTALAGKLNIIVARDLDHTVKFTVKGGVRADADVVFSGPYEGTVPKSVFGK